MTMPFKSRQDSSDELRGLLFGEEVEDVRATREQVNEENVFFTGLGGGGIKEGSGTAFCLLEARKWVGCWSGIDVGAKGGQYAQHIGKNKHRR